MIAGPVGSAPTFFFASAIAARYARLACKRRMQSAYSWEGGLFAVAPPPPALFGGSPGLFVKVLPGSADVGDVGDC